MSRTLTLTTVLVITAAVAACGRANPAEPSAQGATITGAIVAPGGAAATASTGRTDSSGSISAASTAPAGLQVSVAGTTVSALVDAAGQFTLRGVPAGPAELRFTATGLSASLALAELRPGESVTITVSLTGSSATLESERRSSGAEEQLEGRIESLPPTTAHGTFAVAGRTVTTDASTLYYLQGQAATFGALAIGQRVHVKGQVNGASLLARLVNIQNTNTGVGVNINGVITDFTGNRAAFEFKVNGTQVKGDAATVLYGNTQFTEVVNGATVEVKGQQRDGYVYATRLHIVVEDDAEVVVTGVITAKSGTSPDLTLTISPTAGAPATVLTSGTTVVRRKSNVQSPSVLYVNQTVDVEGRLLPGGSIAARHITIVADAVGGTFEMLGHLGNLGGACPARTFQITGYAIATNGTTVFTPAGTCASLANGALVFVKGIVQADLSVLASEVKK